MEPEATLILFIFAWLSKGQGCDYTYTSPPPSLTCNPYKNAMYIECAIKGLDVQTIQWYFSYSKEVNVNHNNTIELHDSTKHRVRNFTSDSDPPIIRSELTVFSFNDSDAGAYWCTGILNDGSSLQTLSSELIVGIQDRENPLPCITDLFLKSSHPKCVSIVDTTDLNFSKVDTTELNSEPFPSVPATTILSTMGSTTSIMNTISAFNNILIVTLCLVAVLFLVCIILMIVIGLQCRKRRKMRNEHRGFHESSGQFLRSITQSAESQFNRKEASGEYAEIGPAIIATVAQHMTDNPHYSSIGDSMLKPPETKSCTNPLWQHPDSHIVENPYDALTSPKQLDGSENGTDKSYSRLDRVVSTGGSNLDKQVSMCEETLDQSEITNNPTEQTSIVEETGKSTEHPYHILEEPKDTTETSSTTSSSSSDTESWSSSSSRSVHLPKDSGISLENHEAISSPVEDEERYQTSDNFSSRDAQRHTYDHLEARDTAEIKYRNVEYLEPVSMIKINQNSDENLSSCYKEESETSFKYSGDYERDPSYMERVQTSKPSSPHYQTLIESTMEPSDNYTKPQSFCK